MTVDPYSFVQFSDNRGELQFLLPEASPGEKGLGPLNRVNFIVGPNNSGKSRLLRLLLTHPAFRYRVAGCTAERLAELTKAIDQRASAGRTGGLNSFPPFGDKGLFTNYASLTWFVEGQDILGDTLQKLMSIANQSDPGTSQVSFSLSAHQAAHHASLALKALRPMAEAALKELSGWTLPKDPPSRLYIPILRGCRRLDNERDLYHECTVREYGLEKVASKIVSGQGMYASVMRLANGKPESRRLLRDYEEFLSKQFFDGQVVEIVARVADAGDPSETVHLRIGDRLEHPIHEWGDGMQAVILSTFAPFTQECRSLVLIEEPETHLHPGLQRRLIELLLTEPRLCRHQYFLSTHSNHFLDMASDYSECTTLHVSPNPGEPLVRHVRAVSGCDRRVLEDLGARASSVLLTNAAVWVEGISDRIYLRIYMARYLADMGRPLHVVEDRHFSFIELGGACAGHYSFGASGDDVGPNRRIDVRRVCSNSMAILDGDTSEKPRTQLLKEALGDRLVLLPGKEIEHLLPIAVLRAWVRKRAPSVDPDAVVESDYISVREPLGKILDAKLGTSAFADGQSITAKADLRDFAVEKLVDPKFSWVLPEPTADICRRVHDFIVKANGL